jgi:cell wall-associated NlpC family hydrolase
VVAALTFAAQHLGTPYRWGGTGNGGFDCSGLAQAAYRQAGITLPRVAQDQFDAGPPVPGSATVQPGDLLFFGSGPTGVDHVGIYVGAGEMIDAPHTGALVRFDDAGWSGLVGATRPA